ncbi:Zn(II)2Cys6 transcription factor [Aspergillus bombycis]|uniref:Zn(II)2Cys6 transcription factor n=1 Tax=Aspergillus bombycis TaxID=109264 RepID=A0A1F8A7P3_9EURO|nr:Zn(II)2Cys6 transcription factor [Aspergillus bombycis]OGM47736.1 Zn(II)2Cys6 transcription factor [Aspergillus bombycis]
MKAQCIISDPFRREHKRQRLSELEHETDELRKRLRSSQSALPQPSPIAMLTAAAEMGVHSTGVEVGLHLTPQSQSPPASCAETSVPSVSLRPPLPRVGYTLGERVSDPTVPRTLSGVEVTGEEIDEIFQLFFDQYAQFLPVLDPLTTPNTYYAQCPFLFWAVIGVACRTYPKNPTLLTALARSITDMALLSLASTSAPWHIIQALLLFLTWPMPKDSTRAELTFPLSGSMLHIAMQNGLHIPMSSHEFTKKRIPAPSEAELMRRSELWARCVIVYQRACSIKGHPPRSFMELEQDFGPREVDVQKLSPSLILERKCQELVGRCSAAVLEIGMSVQNNDAAAKTVIVLNQLWNSTKAFRKSDGSDFPTLRIRSRLMLSPVVDAVWWWREEHDPQYRSGVPSQGNAPDGIDSNRDSTGGVVNAPIGPMERYEPVLFDDQFLADFEWALGDDGLFPSTEPYGSGWSSLGAAI